MRCHGLKVTEVTQTPYPQAVHHELAPWRRGILGATLSIARIKLALIAGGFRGSMQQRVQTFFAFFVAALLGLLALGVLGATASGDHADSLIVIIMAASVIGVVALFAATGLDSSVDSRNLAYLPLTTWELGAGLLTAAAIGPGTVLAAGMGVGMFLGWNPGDVTGTFIVIAAVLGWGASLAALGHTVSTLLGVIASGKYRILAQLTTAGSVLAMWLISQIVAAEFGEVDASKWQQVADVAAMTPPGQLGRAVASAAEPQAALIHLALGLSWLPILFVVACIANARLIKMPPRQSASSSRNRQNSATYGLRGRMYQWVPRGPAQAIAVRTLRLKARNPRQWVNTAAAILISAGLFILSPLFGFTSREPYMVLTGGLLHFSVLFDINNTFGMDGRAIWGEFYSGTTAQSMVRGKLLASWYLMLPIGFIVPIAVAIITSGWAYVPAAWLIAVGAILGAAGVGLISAILGPVALPDNPNPLASGDTGQGILAGIMLFGSSFVLVILSAPLGGLILWMIANDRSVWLITAAAAIAPVIGLLSAWACDRIAVKLMHGREGRLIEAVTPSR